MKTKVIIDFDGTLFDTKLFKEELFKVFKEVGFSDEEILLTYKVECLECHFSLDSFILRFEKIRKFDRDIAGKKIAEILTKLPSYIFPDAISFLEKIDRKKYELDIFTLGNLKFQCQKVDSTGLAKYFDNVYYTEKQKWESLLEIIKVNEHFIFIDDREDTVYRVGEAFKNSVSLRINRKDKDKDDPILKTDKFNNREIKTFDQIFTYLKD